MNGDKNVLRWGGLAGIMGAIIAVLSIIIQLVFAPAPRGDPCGPPCSLDASVASFPTVRAAMTAGSVVYLVAMMLFAILFLTMYRALREGSLAPTLFGSGIGFLGLVLLAAGSLPSVAFAHLSDVYHAAAATPQDQATLVLVSHGVQAILNETDAAGGIFLAVGFILLGLAMRASPSFGSRFAWVSIILGLVALVGILVISIGQDNPNDFAFALLVVILPLLLGWKVYSLSKSA